MTRMACLPLMSLILSMGCHGSELPLPSPIDLLRQEIQGKSPEQVRQLIVKHFGEPARDVGSGVSIEQWDIDGGVLTYTERSAPSYFKNGKSRKLMKTANSAESCLFGIYEMYTVPDRSNNRNSCWIGNLTVSASGEYRFKDSGTNLDQRQGQDQNFFMKHPKGTIRLTYATGITAQSILEDLADGSVVAVLRFTADNKTAEEEFQIIADVQSMMLLFKGKQPQCFEMNKGWVKYWP